MMRTILALLCLALSTSATLAAAQAAYPTKPVRIVVGFPPVGISDNLARALAGALDRQLGQPFVVDNKPGAGTTIAAAVVAKAPPDGYTLFMQDLTSHAINASLYRNLSYDSVKDFTPITLVAATPLVLVVTPQSGITSVQDLIARAKSAPGVLNYGSSGIGSILHLAGESFKHRAGKLDIAHIPYKSGTLVAQAMLAGDLAVSFATLPTAVPLVKSGRLKALAVTSPTRMPTLPEVPTMAEVGMKDFEIQLYSGLLGPPGMSPQLQAQLRSEIIKALQSPEIKKMYADIGMDAVTTTPEETKAILEREIKSLARTVESSGARAD
jgi:tripartite-type tricarboxylate transporter receptor subunit TctC